jgi:hypothetical protein
MIQRPTKLKSFALFKNFSTSFTRKNRFIFVEEVRWGVHSEVRPVYGLVFSCISNYTNNASSAGVRNADRARS